jgi:hypothetical protein
VQEPVLKSDAYVILPGRQLAVRPWRVERHSRHLAGECDCKPRFSWRATFGLVVIGLGVLSVLLAGVVGAPLLISR